MNFKKILLRNIIISGGFNYVAQGVAFLSTVITSRILTPEDFGLVALITVITGFISIFVDSGLSVSIIKNDYSIAFFKAMDNLSFFIGVFLCILLCLLAFPLSIFYKNSSLTYPTILFSPIFIFRSLSSIRVAILSKRLQFGTIGKITLASTLTNVMFTVVLALAGAQYWSLIIPQVIASIMQLILVERKVQLGFKINSWVFIQSAYNKTRNTIFQLSGFNLINYWARNMDNLIIGKFYGADSLGIYSRAYMLLTLPLTFITGLISSVAYPALVKIKDQEKLIESEYKWLLRFISLITYPLTFILVLYSQDIVSFLWGEQWISVSNLSPYFGILIFGQSLLSTAGNILILKNKEKNLMISGWIGAIFMISAILSGALFSIIDIVRFYSLSFILLVLPFNMFYVFIRSLHFDKKNTLLFWMPIIIISLGLWLSCYFNHTTFKIIMLIFQFIFILFNILNNDAKSIKNTVYSSMKGFNG